jgi:mxaJ protein
MPLSNERGEGLENRVAALISRDLGARAEFVWWSARRGYVRNTLGAGRCDVLAGVPAGLPGTLTTRPYYSSSYVFVYREDRGTKLESLEDPRLAKMRIGIHVIGEDYAPPAYALARRGVVNNVVGFSQYGEFGEVDPQAKLLHAVAAGEVDVGVAWGPTAGYFAARERTPLAVVPIRRSRDLPAIPFAFGVAMAVREGEEKLRSEIDTALSRRTAEISALLREYSIPGAPEEP